MSSVESRQPQPELPKRDEAYRFLVEFAYRHLDFQMAELESVLRMNGVILGSDDFQIKALPNHDVFLQSQEDFSRAGTVKQLSENVRRPFVILSVAGDGPFVQRHPEDPGEALSAMILSRCALVRSVLELWAMAGSLEDCSAGVQQWTTESALGKAALVRHSVATRSWKVTVHTLGCSYTVAEQNDMRRHFQFLNLLGNVQLKDCDDEFILIREIELDAQGGAIFPRFGLGKQLIVENDQRPPLAWYFGRVLSGRHVKGRGQINTYSLKKRSYLGPTSMDTELSFVMTNLAHVRPNSVVLDPFVGTGSILLSCALRGAFCMGTDIDLRVLRGKGGDQNVLANFAQYGLSRPELIRSDNALYDRHCRTEHPLYDAIVTDPPYGIRAGARKSGSRLDQPRAIPEEHRHDHIAKTQIYNVSDVMADLLDVSARTLVKGGRLVYVIPSMQNFDPEADLPRHPCLRVAHVCYQPLSLEFGRRMVAMEKIADYDESQKETYLQYVWKNGPESANKCANLREKILEAAQQKPGYQGKLAARKVKRKQTKEARKRAKTAANTELKGCDDS